MFTINRKLALFGQLLILVSIVETISLFTSIEFEKAYDITYNSREFLYVKVRNLLICLEFLSILAL